MTSIVRVHYSNVVMPNINKLQHQKRPIVRSIKLPELRVSEI